tara:strand:+ start:16514 stop:17461 length:948 start_codon:yes stop_codon:yes gene_type:complete
MTQRALTNWWGSGLKAVALARDPYSHWAQTPRRTCWHAAVALGAVWLLSGPLAEAQDFEATVAAVQAYILDEDYPEVFDDIQYRVQVSNLIVTDLNADGVTDVIAQMEPHYRQSATIILYQVTGEGEVSRATEGLAPGPLVALTGGQLDSHGLPSGVDFSVGGDTPGADRQHGLALASVSRFGNVVEYSTFVHADSRSGNGAYVDMSGIDLPAADRTCEGFEFSPIRQTLVGAVRSLSDQRLLAALVGNEIYLYEIGEVLPTGLLRKRVWIIELPADVTELATDETGAVAILRDDGSLILLRPQCPDGEGRCTTG